MRLALRPQSKLLRLVPGAWRDQHVMSDADQVAVVAKGAPVVPLDGR
jgi:hypothetical protein